MSEGTRKRNPLPVVCLVLAGVLGFSAPEEEVAVPRGVVVHVGCGTGEKTATLWTGENVLVQGVDASVANIEAARKHLQGKGLYGPVSIAHWKGGSLPYNDNLVNLLVVDDKSLSRDEAMRVLVPGGMAVFGEETVVKKVPEEIDDWTHCLYDATGNAVSRDRRVGPPRHLQWNVGPRFGRQHEHMSSFTSMVSAGGKIFYVVDEGPGLSVIFPSKWKLIARDAFNGTLCWERPIEKWHSRVWPMKNGPVVLGRRIVAVGNRLFATPGIHDPVSVLDTETGETLRTFEQTKGTWEFVVSDGVIFASAGTDGKFFDYRREIPDMIEERNRIFKTTYERNPKRLLAVDAESGETLWKTVSRMAESSLCVGKRSVVFNDFENLVCLDRKTGEKRWMTAVRQDESYRFGEASTVVLVEDRGVVLFGGMTGKTLAFDSGTGEKLWEAPQPTTGHTSPYDMFVIEGRLWYGQTASGRSPGTFVGIDLKTGKVERTFTMVEKPDWWHHRCHRGRATDRWILTSRTGLELVDWRNGTYDVNHWFRGACSFGIMPANGLIYAPPHPCGCYAATQLSFFNAVGSPESITYEEPERGEADRLVKGAAFAEEMSVEGGSGDWPQYRHDPARSGSTSAEVRPELKQAWEVSLGGRLSACTAADGKVFVAAVDRHTLHALDGETGDVLWRFVAGGRIDSPPAWVRGRLVFGCADGSVYCLSAATGRLAWRYDLAPRKRQMVSLGRMESPWPVHGSVLVRGTTAYCLAGRSRFLDGGMVLGMLDVVTGRLLGQKKLDHKDQTTGKDLHEYVQHLNMPVALSDILSANDGHLFLHQLVMDLEGNTEPSEGSSSGKLAIRPFSENRDRVHLFSPTGFLDDALFHRSYWVWGDGFRSGWGGWYQAGRVMPAGRILVQNEGNVFGFGRRQDEFVVQTPLRYHLFKIDKGLPLVKRPPEKKADRETDGKAGKKGGKKPVWATPPAEKFEYQWSRPVTLYVMALALSKNVLFAAGPQRIVDEDECWENLYEPEVEEKIEKQARLLEGEEGSLLRAVSEETGETLHECRIPGLPVWDGMAVVGGKLFITTREGKIFCFEGK